MRGIDFIKKRFGEIIENIEEADKQDINITPIVLGFLDMRNLKF